MFPKHHRLFRYCIDGLHIELHQVVSINVTETRPWYRRLRRNLPRRTAGSKPVHLGKTLKVKLNEAMLLKVRRWCRAGRLRLSRCEMCACVFPAIMLGEMWKTQSPPVSMETSSHSFAGREAQRAIPHSESGVWIIPHYCSHAIDHFNNILRKTRISGAVTMMCVNLLKRLMINLVLHAAKQLQ